MKPTSFNGQEASQEVVAQQHRMLEVTAGSQTWRPATSKQPFRSCRDKSSQNPATLLQQETSPKFSRPVGKSTTCLSISTMTSGIEGIWISMTWHDRPTSGCPPTSSAKVPPKHRSCIARIRPFEKLKTSIFWGPIDKESPKTCRLPVVTRLFEVRLSCIQQLLAS